MAYEGLAGLKRYQQEQAEKAAQRDRPKAEWFTGVFPKKTGDSVNVVFLQELDKEAENYDEARGIGFIEVEHHGPGKDGFKKRATCTLSEGDCYACERHRSSYQSVADYKGDWKQRSNLYINVAVEVDGEWKPFVLSRNANSTFTETLIQEAIDEGSITNAVYRINKTGSGTKTQWIPKRLPKVAMPDVSGLGVFDINETVLRDIAYEKQPEWYGDAPVSSGNDDQGEGDSSKPTGSSTSADADW